MKIVFDTNVLVSAFIFGGNSGYALEYCIENDTLFISPWIINELKETLKTKFLLPEYEINSIMGFISSEFSIIKPHTNLPINCRDKDDNNILQLAESVFADYIITGDKDLLILKHFKKTRILLPSEFLSLFKD